MKTPGAIIAAFAGSAPAVSTDIRLSRAADVRRRRAIIGLSLLGIANMAPLLLYQTGMTSHVPDPPLPGFDADRTNASEAAYRYGAPDSAFVIAGLGLGIALAAFGTRDRAQRAPMVPIMAAAKNSVEAGLAALAFSWMARGREPWCVFCIAGTAIQWAILALSIPEARSASRHLKAGV